ncbi:5-formyltetrahydrofolate cyclo-ligase [Candidatus Sumerlaeota bacterium]|nr:5-formyltetrahydrofolate cyclo-ligase [Candidatus Sumerlaeota bacterium]
MQTKAELRKIFLRRRRAIPPDDKRQWDRQIFQSLVRLPLLVRANVIMTYLSLPDEVDTFRLVEYLLREGKRVVVPRIDTATKRIIPGEIKNLKDDLSQGHYKVLEPHPQRFRPIRIEEIQLHIVPGIVFDLKGFRIGYNQGYYDRFLATLPPESSTVGLTYECQLVESIPADEWDINVDYVLSEKRLISCRENLPQNTKKG